MKNRIDTRRLYRLPYTKTDNPNAWLEITTRCNERCPGCYRGCDLDTNVGDDRPLAEIREDIITLRELRNCQAISISGGEPLLHPDLDAVIRFIRDQGLRSMLFTNGSLLTEARVGLLREAGLNGIIVRVDPLVDDGSLPERDIEVERDRILAVIQSAKDILPAFTLVLDRRNIDQAVHAVNWAQSRQIGFLVLIARRDFIHNESDRPELDSYLYPDDLADRLTALPEFRFSAYLGSQLDDESVKWIQALRILLDQRPLGYLDSRMIEVLQTWHHLTAGTYSYVPTLGELGVSPLKMALLACFNRSMRAILKTWLSSVLTRPSRLLQTPRLQVINAVFPPSFVNGKRDFCDGCPDAMLYEGRLVPSCVLEEIKKFGAPYVLEEEKH